MKRRSFLKALGVGITVPLLPVNFVQAKASNPDSLILAGGYTLHDDRWWVRVSIKLPDEFGRVREWHDLVMMNGRDFDVSIITKAINRNIAAINVSEDQIREVLKL